METIDKLLETTSGILKLEPNYVSRYYMDHARLGLGENPGDTYKHRGQPLDPRTLDRLHRPGRSPQSGSRRMAIRKGDFSTATTKVATFRRPGKTHHLDRTQSPCGPKRFSAPRWPSAPQRGHSRIRPLDAFRGDPAGALRDDLLCPRRDENRIKEQQFSTRTTRSVFHFHAAAMSGRENFPRKVWISLATGYAWAGDSNKDNLARGEPLPC